MRYLGDVSLINIQRTYHGTEDRIQDSTERLLLAHHFYTECLQCQVALNISKQDEMQMWPILEVKIFDLWGIDFMGSFPSLDGKEYILVAVAYVLKCIEAISTRTNK